MLIDEPPIANFCSGCSKPLTHVFSQRSLKWVAIIVDPSDPESMRAHRCRDGIPQASWRDQHGVASPDSPARTEALRIAAAAAGRSSIAASPLLSETGEGQ